MNFYLNPDGPGFLTITVPIDDPRTYIHCTLGPFSSWMEPFAARARKLGWNVHTMAASHDVMITHPNKLAEILLRIANK
jgi:hypothetical protein